MRLNNNYYNYTIFIPRGYGVTGVVAIFIIRSLVCLYIFGDFEICKLQISPYSCLELLGFCFL